MNKGFKERQTKAFTEKKLSMISDFITDTLDVLGKYCRGTREVERTIQLLIDGVEFIFHERLDVEIVKEDNVRTYKISCLGVEMIGLEATLKVKDEELKEATKELREILQELANGIDDEMLLKGFDKLLKDLRNR